MSSLDLSKLLESAPDEVRSFERLGGNESTPKEQDSYFEKKEYISRSDLYNLAYNKKGYEPAYRQGSIFDAYFTEPELFVTKYSESISDFELLQLIRAKEAIRELKIFPSSFWRWHDSVLQGFPFAKLDDNIKLQRERYREAFEPIEGVKIKARAKYDFLIHDGKKKIIFDLKSTTKSSLKEFVSDIKGHGLDVQASWYTDLEEADEYWLLVVSYQSAGSLRKAYIGHAKDILSSIQKPRAWFFRITPAQIAAGRVKYQDLVKKLVLAGKI